VKISVLLCFFLLMYLKEEGKKPHPSHLSYSCTSTLEHGTSNFDFMRIEWKHLPQKIVFLTTIGIRTTLLFVSLASSPRHYFQKSHSNPEG
jgi:hypothetical protein